MSGPSKSTHVTSSGPQIDNLRWALQFLSVALVQQWRLCGFMSHVYVLHVHILHVLYVYNIFLFIHLPNNNEQFNHLLQTLLPSYLPEVRMTSQYN